MWDDRGQFLRELNTQVLDIRPDGATWNTAARRPAHSFHFVLKYVSSWQTRPHESLAVFGPHDAVVMAFRPNRGGPP